MKLARCFLFVPLLWLVAMSPPCFAQGSKTGTITSTQCVPIDVTQQSTVGIQVTGTWSGTLQPEISIQGQAAQNIQVVPSTSSTAQSTITANGVYTARVAGGSSFLLCGNTVSSGTANVFLNATSGVSLNGIGGGSGSGTVSANNGSAGALANYAAAGGSTTVGPDATLLDNGTTLTYSGSTVKVPQGSAATPSFVLAGDGAGSGMSLVSSAIWGWSSSSAYNSRFAPYSGLWELSSGGGYIWNSAASGFGGSFDSGLFRAAAGTVEVSNSSSGNSNGVLAAAAFQGGGAAATLSGTGACATFSTQSGGSSVGQATCTGATAASTLTITPGTTAPHGWVCYVQDQTTRANLFQQTANNTTTCTLTITSVTQNDVFVFTATQF